MKKVLVSITIDVENPQTPLYEKRFMDNRIWSQGYGIEKIVEILDEHDVKGTFFINVYEYVIWGMGEMERIVKFIHDKGHEVGLHTHPIWIDERRREHMYQYSLEEQEAIIHFGADLIERWTGIPPISHRAGAYGFNKDTLLACKDVGIRIDSSNFFGHPNCRFVLTKNEITEWQGVVEAPVTFFYHGHQIVKTDLDWADEKEISEFIDKALGEKEIGFTNLFLHSYSLTYSEDHFKTFQPNLDKITKLNTILSNLANRDRVDFLPLKKILEWHKDRVPREFPVISIKKSSEFETLNLSESQWYPLQKLRDFQNYHLRKLIHHCYEHVPFYRDYMKGKDIHPEDIKTVEDLAHFPVIDKNIIKEQSNSFIADNASDFRPGWSKTSGTTGTPLRFLLDAKKQELETFFVNQSWYWAGLRPGIKLIVMRGFKLENIVIERMMYGQRALALSQYHLSKENLRYFIEKIKEYTKPILYAYPSNLYRFARMIAQERIEPPSFTSLVTSSETLYPAQRKFIEEFFGVRIYDIYGQGERVCYISQCPEGKYHEFMEYGITEFLEDPDLPEGMKSIVATGLHNYSMPFIRYKLGDMALVSDTPCSCGRDYPSIEFIEGKSGDMIFRKDGSSFSGVALTNVLGEYPEILEYQLKQHKDLSVTIYYVDAGSFSKRKQEQLKDQLSEYLGKDIPVKFEEVGSISRTPSGKMRFIVSEVEKGQIVNDVKEGDSTIRVVSTDTGELDSDVNKSIKICHIGGAHAVQMVDIIKELDERGFPQCVISYYPKEKSIVPKHIPVYYFPFRSYESPDWQRLELGKKLEEFLREIFAIEQPDIVHGHSLTYSCIPVWMAKKKFNIKTVILPWSINTIKDPNPVANYYEKLCLDSCDYIMLGLKSLFKTFQEYYGNIPDEKFILFRPLIDLSLYGTERKITKIPKILSARVMGEYYRQDLLIKSIPALVREFPDLKVTLIIGSNPEQGKPYFDAMIELAKSLGVYEWCEFISYRLTQKEFAELIKSHNIIYSITTHDVGFSATDIQAMFSGAIVITNDYPETQDVIIDKKNALKTKVDERSIRDTLLYAVKNLVPLQRKFIKENKIYKMYDKENMMRNLIDCYLKLIEIKKEQNVISHFKKN